MPMTPAASGSVRSAPSKRASGSNAASGGAYNMEPIPGGAHLAVHITQVVHAARRVGCLHLRPS